MKKIDYIIVGQGIAGTMLSWSLLERGKSVLVVDYYNASSCSNVAAGIFNPITGRRFVKTWMADTLFPFAEKTYLEMEKQLDVRFFHPMPILRSIADDLEQKEFEKKSRRPDYLEYLGERVSNGSHQAVVINHGGYVDFTVLLEAYRKKLKKEGLLLDSHFTFHDLNLEGRDIAWRDYAPRKIIFCEGYHVLNNPFFSHLPFTSSKGEILTVKTDAKPEHQLINSDIFMLPVGDQHFLVGATYNWDDRTETPTEAAKKELILKLAKVIGSNFRVTDHKAGIRPTVKDRHPIIGLHPEFHNIGIFNGLGTKGASLAPYLASQFVDHLEQGVPLEEEVDIQRFDFNR